MRVLYRTTPTHYEGGVENGKIIDPTKITLAFIIGGTPGRNTCKAKCEYCFIPTALTYSSSHNAENLQEKIQLESRQIVDLRLQGYNVVPMVPDTFAWNGAYLKSDLLFQNPLYDQDELEGEGIAWTSGMPLLKSNDPYNLLRLAYQNNLKVLAITSHGIKDGEIPLRGVIQPTRVRQVL